MNHSDDPEIQNQQQNEEELFDQQMQITQPNNQIPFEEYRESFTIFSKRKRPNDITSYINIVDKPKQLTMTGYHNKLKSQLNLFINQCQSQTQKEEQKQSSQLSKINLEPFEHFWLSRLKSNLTIFVKIQTVDKLRCNMMAFNSAGYIYACYTNLKICRKYPKIYKLMQKFYRPLKHQQSVKPVKPVQPIQHVQHVTPVQHVAHVQTLMPIQLLQSLQAVDLAQQVKKEQTVRDVLFVIEDDIQTIDKNVSAIERLFQKTTDLCYFVTLQQQELPIKFGLSIVQSGKLNISQRKQKRKKQQIKKQNRQKKKQHKKELKYGVLTIKNRFYCVSQIFFRQQTLVKQNILKMSQIYDNLYKKINLIFPLNIRQSSLNYKYKCLISNYQRRFCYQSLDQLLFNFRKMFQNGRQTLDNKFKQQNFKGNVNDHFPQMLKNCKICCYCSKNYDQNDKRRRSKTKYKCQGCTAKNKRDVPLCIDCFSKYHQKLYTANQRRQNLKNYRRSLKQNYNQKQPDNHNKIQKDDYIKEQQDIYIQKQQENYIERQQNNQRNQYNYNQRRQQKQIQVYIQNASVWTQRSNQIQILSQQKSIIEVQPQVKIQVSTIEQNNYHESKQNTKYKFSYNVQYFSLYEELHKKRQIFFQSLKKNKNYQNMAVLYDTLKDLTERTSQNYNQTRFQINNQITDPFQRQNLKSDL